MKRLTCLISLFAALSAILSCSQKKTVLPDISGRAGEVIVVTGKTQWEGEIGNAIRDALASDYGCLPQDEPSFNLMNVPAPGVNRLIKAHRNMIYVQVDDTSSRGVKVRKDVWAQPQTMVIVTSPDEAAASATIRDNSTFIKEAFEKAERDRNIAAAKAFEDASIRAVVEERFGGSPYFPNNYSIKKNTRDFLWISYETSFSSQGIFIYSFPYGNPAQLEAPYLVAKRDEVMKDNVPATAPDSYMITSPMLEPVMRKVSCGGITRSELRGLWDTHNDYMGGPFIQHAFLSRDSASVIVAEGFVYAPKYNKRDYVRQVEGIISSFHWSEQ